MIHHRSFTNVEEVPGPGCIGQGTSPRKPLPHLLFNLPIRQDQAETSKFPVSSILLEEMLPGLLHTATLAVGPVHLLSPYIPRH